MTRTPAALSVPRRSFFARLAAAGAALGLVDASSAQVEAAPARAFQPARHTEDDWYDALPGKHRFFLDSVSPHGAGEAIAYATNFFVANKSGYSLQDSDLAVVICLRHLATPLAFGDAIWAKYGGAIAEEMKFTDPKTGKPPTGNVYNATTYGSALPNRGISLDTLLGRGVHFAVCGLATRRFASVIATQTGGAADALFKEVVAGMIPNCHVVSAGIVAVGRAQERGYTFSYVG